MKILIIKLGATGDVVRTTPLLSQLSGQITWLTAAKNSTLLENLTANLRCFSWEERANAMDTHYDLAINLEDTIDVAQFLRTIECSEIFGAYLSPNGSVTYTESSRRWFDLSLISSYGRERADGLKLLNRQTYL
jgi:ADP-heptose:LPS heptosyltransferase